MPHCSILLNLGGKYARDLFYWSLNFPFFELFHTQQEMKCRWKGNGLNARTQDSRIELAFESNLWWNWIVVRMYPLSEIGLHPFARVMDDDKNLSCTNTILARCRHCWKCFCVSPSGPPQAKTTRHMPVVEQSGFITPCSQEEHIA